MTTARPRLHIFILSDFILSDFILSDLVQIKRDRRSTELMPLAEADALGRDLCLAVAAARATQPIKQSRRPPMLPEVCAKLGEAGDPGS